MQKRINTIFFICFAIVAMLSCKKSKNNTTTPVFNPASEQITLFTPVITGDSVKLSWTKLENDSLVDYKVMFNYDSIAGAMFGYFSAYKNTEYSDYFSLRPYVQYYIVAQLSSGRTISSNKVIVDRANINFMGITPIDVLCDKELNLLYLYDGNGNFILYDVTTDKILKQITANAMNGYCFIDVFNGKKELYVPRSDGWLFIYDAATLTQIDQINIGGNLGSVVSSSGILYINSYLYMQAYNRVNKLPVSQTIGNQNAMKVLPKSNTEIISFNSISFSIYKFTSGGVFISNQGYGYPTLVYSSPIVEMSPDGSKIIYSNEGIVCNDSFYVISSLPRGSNSFTSFDFDTTHQLIYAANSSSTIQSYSMANYQLSTSIKTKGFPVKVFYNNGSIICVSNTSNDPSFQNLKATCFVEQF